MITPAAKWYSAIFNRRSRRRFDPDRQIEPAVLASIDKICKEFVPFSHTRTCLVNTPADDIFRGAVGNYGRISGAPVFIAFIGNTGGLSVQEEVGYTGEGIILEATSIGLNTCWVGGFFKPQAVAALIKIGPDERVLAVSPLGYAVQSESFAEKVMTGFGRTHKRLPLSDLTENSTAGDVPEWMRGAVEAARLAPSAVNRQPWGFILENDGITVRERTKGPDFHISKRLDCGIAMLHIAAAAIHYGIEGRWEFLNSPLVAKFKVTA